MTDVNVQEIDEAVRVCFYLIDNPPPQYRIVKQAVQGITHLSTVRTELRPLVLLKLLQVLQQPKIYRQSLSSFKLTAGSDRIQEDLQFEVLTVLTLEAFCALSRIGRKYPAVQSYILPLFEDAYNNPHEKDSIIWGVLIGWGRLCQSNAVLRSNVFTRLVDMCSSRSFKLRWGAIKALGHASCPIGNVSNDKLLEQQCFELALKLLEDGGAKINSNNTDTKQSKETEPDPWKREDVYLVQYAAMQALSLLLRSNPEQWWNSISGILKDVLTNGRYAAIVKASCLLTYGKLAYYMSEDNPYYTNLKNLLFDLSHHDNILVSEPACYSLVNLCLAHPSEFDFVKNLIRQKLGGSLGNAPPQALEYYLKTWCKLISKDYRTVLNQCSTVMSMHAQSDATGNFAPGFDDATSQGKKSNEDSTTKLSDSATAADSNKLLELCTNFSTAVLGSILAMFKDPLILNNTQFRKNLKVLVQDYQNKSNINSEITIDQTGLLKLFKDIWSLDPILRENAVTIMNYPAILDNPLWVANLQAIIQNLNQLKLFQPPLPQVPVLPSREVAPAASSSSFFAPLPLLTMESRPVPQVSSAADFFAPLPTLPSAPRDPRLQKVVESKPPPQLEPLPLLNPPSNSFVKKPVHIPENGLSKPQPTKESPVDPLLTQLNQEEEEDMEFVLNASAEEIKFPLQPVPKPQVVSQPQLVSITQPQQEAQIPVVVLPQELESESDDEWNPNNLEDILQPAPHVTPKQIPNDSKQDTASQANNVCDTKQLFDTNSIPLDGSEEEGAIKGEENMVIPPPSSYPKRKNKKKKRKRETHKPKEEKPAPKPTSPKEAKKKEAPASSGTILSSILASEDFKDATVEEFDEEFELSDSGPEKDKKIEEPVKESKKPIPKKPRKKVEKERPQDICKFYLAGLCKRGQDCTFAHVGTPTPVKHTEVCKFFKSGFCLKGDQCLYSHDLKSQPCKYFLETGHCIHGTNCKYGHFYPNADDSTTIAPPPTSQASANPFPTAVVSQQTPPVAPVQLPPSQPTDMFPHANQQTSSEAFSFQTQPEDDDFAGSYLAACYEKTS